MKARKLVKRILKAMLSKHFDIPVEDIKELKSFSALDIYSYHLEDLKPTINALFNIETRKRELRDCDDLYDMIDLVLEKLGWNDEDEIAINTVSHGPRYPRQGNNGQGLSLKEGMQIASLACNILGINVAGLLGIEHALGAGYES
jgi:hypothetical protein